MGAKELKPAFIIDIDGILSKSEVRGQFKDDVAKGNFEFFANMMPHFQPNKWAVGLTKALSHDYVVIFLTARSEEYRQDTCDWIHRHVGISNFKLIMRDVSGEEDHVVKKRLYLEKVRGRYHVLAAIDDTKEVSKLWKTLNIPSLWLLTEEVQIEQE